MFVCRFVCAVAVLVVSCFFVVCLRVCFLLLLSLINLVLMVLFYFSSLVVAVMAVVVRLFVCYCYCCCTFLLSFATNLTTDLLHLKG